MINNSCKTVLNNGIRIITESLPVRTVSVGIWVNTGSRDETDVTNGTAHFLEHMLFKGTDTFSARKIARELDSLGGASNAFTSKENTCLYATVLDTQLPRLISLYSDLFLHSKFSPEEVDRERKVILQEIDMIEDNPEDLIHDLYSSSMWSGHPLGQTVLGSEDVVSTISPEKLRDFVEQFYVPENIVISAAGNLNHDDFVNLLDLNFSKVQKSRSSSSISHGGRKSPSPLPPFQKTYPRSLEQAHVVLGTYGLAADSPQRYTMVLLNILLGGNMSSRLFQEVREKLGLAYSIYSFAETNIDSGQLCIGTGVNPNKVTEVISVIEKIVGELACGTVDKEELDRAKGYAKANLYLAAESMDARMMRLAKNELIFDRQVSFDEVDESLAKVNYQQVNQLAADLFSKPLSSVILGTVEES